ncbi:MAG: hypothetical protein EOO77_01050 [Oxalobacteraceae bacterium]|nr:MAG: hypothetical protein EOO77_01050 [Oxalobacteraceae bacterium]
MSLALVSFLTMIALPFYWAVLILICWRKVGVLRVVCACMVMPVAAGVLGNALTFSAHHFVSVFDPVVIQIDGSLGVQPVTIASTLLHSCPPLSGLCLIVYALLTSSVAMSAALEMVSGRRQGLGVLPTFMVAGVLGFCVFMIVPVVGPLPYFGQDLYSEILFDRLTIKFSDLSNIPKNCVPSLHATWATLAFLATRGRSFVARVISGCFLALTLLATIGFGFHYLTDLVVAAPFILIVRSLCAVNIPWSRRRALCLVVGCILVFTWCLVLRSGLREPWLNFAPVGMIITLVTAYMFEQSLAMVEGFSSYRISSKPDGACITLSNDR